MSHNGKRIIFIGLFLVGINVLFSVSPAFGGWLSGWGKRVKITTDNTDIDSALSNFPVLIYLSSASGRDSPKDDVTFVFDEVGSNSKKIAVTTSDGTTQCYVEIEKWDSVSEKAWLWVKVPSISSTADTDLYLYYDNTQADNTAYVGDKESTPAMDVWSNNFGGVWHLDEDPTATPTDWGKTAIATYSTTSNHSRAMGGTSPNVDNMKIKSISIYLGDQIGDVRLAVYTGGDLDDPTNATLLWDAGTVNPGGTAGWYTINHPAGGVDWPENTVTWLAWKRNTGVAVYYDTTVYGDFQTVRGRNNNSFNQDPGVAFPSTYGETGTFANYWYSIYVTYQVEPIRDSTSNANHGTPGGAMTSSDQVAGRIDGSLDLDGADDYFTIGTTGFSAAAGTVEVWVDIDTFPPLNGTEYPFSHHATPTANRFYIFTINDAGTNKWGTGMGDTYRLDTGSALSADTWYHLTITWDGTYVRGYKNGVLDFGPTAYSGLTAISNAWVGSWDGASEFHDGIIDEVRVSSVERTTAWIKAGYETGRDDLVDFGSEEQEPPTGWLSGWANRVKITTDNTDIDSVLSNFPVLIYLSSASGRDSPKDDVTFVFDEVGSNSKKIAVTKDDGTTQLYVEIEKWDSVSEKAWLWVKVPSINSTADTDLYLYYDNTQADNTTYVGGKESTPAQNVWDGNFKLVQHLNEDPSGIAPQMKDSTSNNNDGTSNGAMTSSDQVAGRIDGSLDFDGTDDYIQVAHHTSIDFADEDFTVELWLKTSFTEVDDRFFCKGMSGAPGKRYELYLGDGPDKYPRFVVDDDVTKSVVQWTSIAWVDGAWHHWAFRRDTVNNLLKIFYDGAEVASDIDGSGSIANTYNLVFPTNDPSEGGGNLEGVLDEFRISATARSAAWIKASYESERDDLLDFEGTGVPALSVSISTDTYNFGTFYGSTITVSSANITVTNDGNVTETYSIKCSSSSYWAVNSIPGNDEFTLQAAFHSSQPSNDDISWKADDILTESLQQCTTAAFSIDGSQHGKDVPPSEIRNIWFRLKTPLSTSTTTQQSITVTISAEWP